MQVKDLRAGPARQRHGIARPLTAGFAAVLLALAAVPLGLSSGQEAQAALLQRPNIVLIVTDDQTMESVAKMPHVSSRTDWVSFTNAYIQNAMCCPSRATILSGRDDTHTRVTNNGEARNFNATHTIATWLSGSGYRTGLFGKYLNNYPKAVAGGVKPPGWTTFHGVAEGGGLYAQYNYDIIADGVTQHFGYAPADNQVNVLTARAKQFIADSGPDPFFMYFAPTATHGPWRASPARTGMFTGAPIPRNDALFNEPDVSDKPAFIRNHILQPVTRMDNERRKEWAAAVSVDDAIAALDAQLVASGDADNTVMIIMTDNGFSFGEHRWYGKACQYKVCNSTPLLVRYPGTAAKSVPNMVGNVDIASTVADMAGVTPGIAQDGRSLLPLVEGTATTWTDEVLHHWPGTISRLTTAPNYVPPFWAIRTPEHLYVELGTGERELYDLQQDPDELSNVASTAENQPVQAQLASRLAVLKKAATTR